MILFFYGITALVSLLGGMVILSRSGASHGRAIARGLLAIAATEVSYLIFYLRESLLALQAASFFELASISFFIISVISMERNISRKVQFVHWTRQCLIVICALYGLTLLVYPEAYAYTHLDDAVFIGWLGRIQSLLLMTGAIAFIWIMENILRSSQGANRRILKYPALGSISVGASLCIASIYRLSTNSISHDILILCSLITLVGVAFLIFFSIRFKLFEMDIFVSRYVVYHSITLISIGTYLLFTGLILLWIQQLGVRLSLVVTGFIVFLALILLSIFLLSPEARARIRFFINTHFFSNKYDYRKEWGELSGYLAIAFNENQIIHVTSQVILDSMYIRELSIWMLEGASFRCSFSFPDMSGETTISDNHPLVNYLGGNPYFMRRTPCRTNDSLWEDIVKNHADFLNRNKVELAVGMTAGTMIGFIAIGKENPGTPYGQDDIDLLSAVASQASAALISTRYANKLAENKELDTYNRISATVLHDLKNAAGHLSLILQNAPKHMNQAEFRKDMLDTISEALARIDKVMGKFKTIPEHVEIHPKTFKIKPFIEELLDGLRPRLENIQIIYDSNNELEVTTDPDVLDKILENIIVNATEAVGDDGTIRIAAGMERDSSVITITDNGIGMTDEFIREKLFKPFQTTKSNGTGLGLWQVKNMADQIKVRIDVTQNRDRGVTVSIWFPRKSLGK
jgi:putative PEP-CTERM system histidine kinase